MVGKFNHRADESKDYLNHLKDNNLSLAKDLTREKLLSKQYLSEKLWLQQKLHTATLLNLRYESILKNVLAQSKHTLPSCITLTDNIAQMFKLCSDGVNLTENLKEEKHSTIGKVSLCPNLRPISPGVSNKTRAVQPMVSGHVIFRPTINLCRLNGTEHSVAESTSTNENVSQNSESTMDESERLLANNGDDSLFLDNHQLMRSYQLANAIADDDDATLEVAENSNESRMHVSAPEMLPALLEDNESVNEDPINLNELREVSVVINVIPPETMQEPTESLLSDSSSRSDISLNYDPIEGPSNLLDNRGHVRRFNTKRKFVNHLCITDDSDSDNDEVSPIIKSKKQNKRSCSNSKINTNRRKAQISVDQYNATDAIDHTTVVEEKTPKKKFKRIRKNKNVLLDVTGPVVVLTKLPVNVESPLRTDAANSNSKPSTPAKKNPERNSNRDHRLITNRTSPNGTLSKSRPKRNRQIDSYKEVSLSCKMRRAK